MPGHDGHSGESDLSTSQDTTKSVENTSALLEIAQKPAQKHPEEGNSERGAALTNKSKGKGIQHEIRFPIYEMPDQLVATQVIPEIEEQIQHNGISCDGQDCGKARPQSKVLGINV